MIVQPRRAQRRRPGGIEHALWATHKIRTVRVSLAEVRRRATLDGPNRVLRLDGGSGFEVAVVYFRAGTRRTTTRARASGRRGAPSSGPTLSSARRWRSNWRARRRCSKHSRSPTPSRVRRTRARRRAPLVLRPPRRPRRRRRLRRAEAVERACEAPDCTCSSLSARAAGTTSSAPSSATRSARWAPPSMRRTSLWSESCRPPTRRRSCAAASSTAASARASSASSVSSSAMASAPCSTRRRASCVKLDGVDEGGVCAAFACLSNPALYP